MYHYFIFTNLLNLILGVIPPVAFNIDGSKVLTKVNSVLEYFLDDQHFVPPLASSADL